jgi:type I restriction enzyme S subunit
VDWLREVPAHWDVKRLRFTVLGALNGVWGEEADGGDDDLPCVRVADFDRTAQAVRDPVPTFRKISKAERHRRVLRRGDLLLEKSGGGEQQPVGAVVLYDRDEPAVCSNFVARLEVASGHSPRFLSYLHASLYSGRINERSIKQTTGIQNLDASSYLDEPVSIPPWNEQTAIAAFLDRETARIDALIKKRQRMILLLQEKRAALITHAVTRGIDLDVPLKDSGVDWLGPIPVNWEVLTLAKLTTKLTNGYVGPTRDMFADEGVPYLQSLHIKDNSIRFGADYFVPKAWSDRHRKSILKADDVLVVQTGDIGQVAHVGHRWAGSNCHALIICSPEEERIGGRFLSWLLASTYGQAQFEALKTGALHPHLNCGNIKHMPIPVPPVQEQLRIAAHVDRETARIETIGEQARSAIELLTEYRASLITAAVTGQIDVRSHATA